MGMRTTTTLRSSCLYLLFYFWIVGLCCSMMNGKSGVPVVVVVHGYSGSLLFPLRNKAKNVYSPWTANRRRRQQQDHHNRPLFSQLVDSSKTDTGTTTLTNPSSSSSSSPPPHLLIVNGDSSHELSSPTTKPAPPPPTTTTTTTRRRDILLSLSRDLHRLSILRPNQWTADFSAPKTIISAGSSYTRLWNHETWKKHDSTYPHVRYFRHVRRWPSSTTARKVMRSSLLAAAWACIVSIWYTYDISTATALVAGGGGGGGGGLGYFSKASKGATAAMSALSAPLALLLTLRTNASLARLQETRLAWGRLVLLTRQMASLLRTHVLPTHPEAAALAARHLSLFGWCLKGALRGEGRDREEEIVQAVFGKNHVKELEWLLRHPRPTWGIVARLRSILGTIATTKALLSSSSSSSSSFLVPHDHLETGISALESVAGVCERILGSPIPPTYSRHLSRVLTIWLATLPLGLMGSGIPALGTVFATGFTSYVLIGLDEIGMEIEHPFPLLPLQQLAAAAQNGVSMQLMDYECNPAAGPITTNATSTTGEGKEDDTSTTADVDGLDRLSFEMPDVPLH
jgi:ion channel-forming bestrophin family protein